MVGAREWGREARKWEIRGKRIGTRGERMTNQELF